MYTYPLMPLKANVWYAGYYLIPPAPPSAAPDDEVDVSLSPVSPGIFATAGGDYTQRVPSHIIRTATNPRIGGSATTDWEQGLVTATVWEIPPGSGHLYWTINAHVCGAGFSNEHHRVYVQRYKPTGATGSPDAPGWI